MAPGRPPRARARSPPNSAPRAAPRRPSRRLHLRRRAPPIAARPPPAGGVPTMLQRPVPWPDGAKVAVAITFDMDADSLLHLAHPRDSITSRLDPLDAALRPRGGPAADPRGLPALRPQADLLRARLVHRAVSPRGRGDGAGRSRGRLPRLHPRGAQRALARGGALLDAALDRGHRGANRPTAARQPRAALQLLDPHRRAPRRGGLPLRFLADGRRRALPAQHAARASWSSCR